MTMGASRDDSLSAVLLINPPHRGFFLTATQARGEAMSGGMMVLFEMCA